MSSPQERLQALLAQFSLTEVVSLLSAKNLWHTNGVTGVPSIRVSDGPNGVRGIRTFNGSKTACFPSAVALASSWDQDLMREVGHEMATQAKAKGVHVILAPTINIHRSPLGGRNFEAFSEDPVLTGRLASKLIQGIQSQGVGATVKHFVCNDQETDRTKINVLVQARPLREIYLKAFQIVIREGNPWAVMSSYNRVNGTHVSESEDLLNGVLRTEWGWRGLIMSDWWGTYSSSHALRAGLDLEMPGPSVWRGERILRAIAAGKLEPATIYKSAANVLTLVEKVKMSGISENAPEMEANSESSRALNRKAAAEAIVLLKNEDSLLPLKSPVTVAVIGPNSKKDVSTGGGSASLSQYYYISAYAGIKSAFAERSPETVVSFAQGCYSHELLPLLETKTLSGEAGMDLEFFKHPFDFAQKDSAEAVVKLTTSLSRMAFFDSLPAEVMPVVWIHCTGSYSPVIDGDYEFGIVTTGRAKLFVNGELVVENWTKQEKGHQFFGMGTKELRCTTRLYSNETYKISIEYSSLSSFPDRKPADLGGGVLRIGACRIVPNSELIAEAVALASSVETVILCLGTDQERESEGFDRKDMKLTGDQDALAVAVLSANPKTAIVNFSGSPIEMPWAHAASAIVQSWFLGSELGNGLADVLLGKSNPSGKLPVTFPLRLEHNPSYGNFPGENGTVTYAEGLLVGYRHYTTRHFLTLFPFGHGLSYTSFAYSNLAISSLPTSATQPVTVTLSVQNTGKMSGHATVQLYVTPPVTSSVFRPLRELQAFQKTKDLNPGEMRTAELKVGREAFSYWEEGSKSWVVENGIYGVHIGESSEKMLLQGEVKVDQGWAWTGA